MVSNINIHAYILVSMKTAANICSVKSKSSRRANERKGKSPSSFNIMSKSTIYQLGKAHQNIFQNGIEQKKDNIFKVRSTTDRRRKYDTTRKSCTCIGFSFRGHCSHITALRVLSRATNISNLKRCSVC